MSDNLIYAIIDYEDEYVQPLLISAIKNCLPAELLIFINDISELPSRASRLLQWRQYESLDFNHLLSRPKSSSANSYIIRKALIRKHYLSTTVHHWLTKYPSNVLRDHVKPSIDFELDYAEFLDDALVEAWELKESWSRNEAANAHGEDVEWWILKPGMSERGQGIRLFSSEEDLTTIFEGWDPSDDEEDDDDLEDESARTNELVDADNSTGHPNGIMTSHLRHFVAQPYIHPPLLLPKPHPATGRKFHVRTYVLAVGALKVYVYRPMLALFAAETYVSPDGSANENLAGHLTNTCLQESNEREGSVHTFWSLPSRLDSAATRMPEGKHWREDAFSQICATTGEVFQAAARCMGIHFQPLPNAFEVFALDFLLDQKGTAWLLEVNAFPDFKQTGEELKGLVEGFFEAVVEAAIKPYFLLEPSGGELDGKDLVEVLNIDLGRG